MEKIPINLSMDREWTIEANPGHINKLKEATSENVKNIINIFIREDELDFLFVSQNEWMIQEGLKILWDTKDREWFIITNTF